MVDLSGLVQWIPVAAIVGAAGAYIFREVEAWLSRKRELKGLLRLLAVEIEYNETILKEFAKAPIVIRELPGTSLHTQAWEENRGRIAQLLKHGEDFQDLANYFMNIAGFKSTAWRVWGRRTWSTTPTSCWGICPNS